VARIPHGTLTLTSRCRGMDITTIVGSLAALGTTVSYFPQLLKCWKTGQAGDLSFKMFAILAAGVALWVVYGFLKNDYVIITSNTVSLCLLAGILSFKLRERIGHGEGASIGARRLSDSSRNDLVPADMEKILLGCTQQ
jgi:MtN3 and saliva related transmembrane protein